MDSDEEAYVLLLLADSNLPTGSFVASSGLESCLTHGFSQSSHTDFIISFVRDSVQTYAHGSLPFVSDAHRVVTGLYVGEDTLQHVLSEVTVLDEHYHAMTLNHIARRASQSQGVALLSLFAKGFSRPASIPAPESVDDRDREVRLNGLVDTFKTMARKGETHSHLPICWGILTAALRLSLERSQYLYLFLHARGILSAAVRLNTLGPYAAQQVLRHAVRPIITSEVSRCKHLRTGIKLRGDDLALDEAIDGPATTWPLGEILAARHDLQHSRIFNS